MSASFVLIIHDVEDYAVWREIFYEAASIRKQAGEISFQLLRTQVDANRIVHFSCWRSLGEARRFFESDKLVAIRRRAGVKAPEFIYLTELDHGTL